MGKKVSVKDKVKKAKKELIEEATPEAAKNVTKLEGDMEFSEKALIDKIKEARTLTDLESTQDYFEELFGEGADIPADIQELYNAKVAEINAVSVIDPNIPAGWVKMSREEAKQHEAIGKLMGYDSERGCGLIKQ